jgi:tetratricopeptide (TPR) repeat protein
MAFDLIKEAILASGVKGEGISLYIKRLHLLIQRFILEEGDIRDPLSRARTLFKWLWKKKPGRYKPHGSFRLNEVIDAQIEEMPGPVGNCLGLTLLYNSLLKLTGIEPLGLFIENAFDIGPHVLTMIQIDEISIDVENILPNGFDYKGHLNRTRTLWGDRELVADIYNSRGNEHFERGELKQALLAYNRAIELNPLYERARLNRAILLDRIKTHEEQ